MVSSIQIFPLDSGNKIRIYNLIQRMRSMGTEVDFLYCKDNFFSPVSEAAIKEMRREIGADHFFLFSDLEIKLSAKLKRKLRELLEKCNLSKKIIITYHTDELYDPKLGEKCNRLIRKKHYDVIWLEYIWFSKIFDEISDKRVLKVIDTHDIMSKRHEKYLSLGQKPDFYYTTRRQERKSLSRADIVVAIQNREEYFFRRLLKRGKKIVTIGDCIEKSENILVKNPSICFVGAANTFNVQGIRYFINEVFPLIQKEMPQVCFYIVGRVCDMIPDSDDYIKCGVVNHICDVYEKVRVVINPVQQGTGLNIKSIEAIANTKPLVSTSVGVKGLHSDKECFKVADEPKRFAEMIVWLLTSDDECEKLMHNCSRFIDQYNKKNERALRGIVKWASDRIYE